MQPLAVEKNLQTKIDRKNFEIKNFIIQLNKTRLKCSCVYTTRCSLQTQSTYQRAQTHRPHRVHLGFVLS